MLEMQLRNSYNQTNTCCKTFGKARRESCKLKVSTRTGSAHKARRSEGRHSKQQALNTANSMTFISDQKHTSAPKGAPCEGGVSDCSDPGPLLDVCAVGCGLCGQTTACILFLLFSVGWNGRASLLLRLVVLLLTVVKLLLLLAFSLIKSVLAAFLAGLVFGVQLCVGLLLLALLALLLLSFLHEHHALDCGCPIIGACRCSWIYEGWHYWWEWGSDFVRSRRLA